MWNYLIQNNMADIHYPPTVDELTSLHSPLTVSLAEWLALANETLAHLTQSKSLKCASAVEFALLHSDDLSQKDHTLCSH